MFEGKISYEILEDGTCSYCGREADMIQLPDGGVTRSAYCERCDEYNLEQRLAYLAGENADLEEE